MRHRRTYHVAQWTPRNDVRLAHVRRTPAPEAGPWWFDQARGAGVLLVGTVLCAQPRPHRVQPAEFLAEYLDAKDSSWSRWDGDFVAILVDDRENQLVIGNGRLGMRPLFYRRSSNVFEFASEAKPLLLSGARGIRYSPEGLVTFLTAGFCLGETTPFDDVKVLEPGTVMTLGLHDLQLRK